MRDEMKGYWWIRFSVWALLLCASYVSAQSPVLPAATRTEEENRTIQVYKSTNEAVVFIVTKSLAIDPTELFPEVHEVEGSGSGIVINSEKGIIITNHHVIQDAQEVEITMGDGQSYPARLIGFDKEYDIAVLQLRDPPAKLISLRFGDSSRLEVGQRVLAIGNPFGLNRTLTSGIISSLDRAVRGPQGTIMKGLIQTDAAINPGNSGGPLLDADGRLIGMNTAILSQSGDNAGIGFAVPINQIRRVLPELIATGRVLRPRIGWLLVDTNHGPMVLYVGKGSPADRAGVRPARVPSTAFLKGYVGDTDRADFIYEVNGKAVQSKDEVEDLVADSEAGKPIEFTMRRGGMNGRSRKVEITPVLR
jgi:S1-C subfamily serine protease